MFGNLKLVLLSVLILGGLAQPTWAGLTRTARGSVNSKTSGTTLTLAVTAAAGSSLIVSIVDDAGGLVSGISWNGATFSEDAIADNLFNLIRTHIWSAHNVPAGTALTMTVTWIAAVTAKAFTVSEISGWPNQGVLDLKTSAIGTSSSADSGATGTTTDSSEYWAGAIGVRGPTNDAAPSWLNSFSAGQRDGTTGAGAASNRTINEGFQIVLATGTADAAATLGTSRDWGAAVATYKNRAAAAACANFIALLGAGCQ